MGSRKLIICDTGVVSRFLTDTIEFVEAVHKIGLDNILITTTIKIELFQWINGYKSIIGEKSYRDILSKISALQTIPIDRKVSLVAVELSKRYFFGVGDILSAAVAIEYDLEIFTINRKHFRKIKGLDLYEPPNFRK